MARVGLVSSGRISARTLAGFRPWQYNGPPPMAPVTVCHVNRERRCFSAAIRPDSAEFGGQTAQQVGRMAVVPDAGEPLSPQAPAICGRGRGGAQTPHSQSPVRPRIPRPPSSTARSRQGILKPGERIGADGSAPAARQLSLVREDACGDRRDEPDVAPLAWCSMPGLLTAAAAALLRRTGPDGRTGHAFGSGNPTAAGTCGALVRRQHARGLADLRPGPVPRQTTADLTAPARCGPESRRRSARSGVTDPVLADLSAVA